ncbi:MAG: hypothetical protein GSR80_000323 [Desulfurococcales archaeon]|nr:hypothetical protein [Desulfurococcales archaeon]
MPILAGASRRWRAGQASAISVAILTAAVLALGLALYGYFAGHARAAQLQQALVSAYGDYSRALTIHVEASYINTSTPTPTACYVVSINNVAGAPVRAYLTILPAAQGPQGVPILDPAISRIPLDTTQTPPKLTALPYYIEDVNGDGVLDVVGSGGRVVPGNPWLPSCDEIYYSTTYQIEALQPEYAPANEIELGLSGLSLAGLAQSKLGVTLNETPVWGFTLQPGGKLSLFIYVELAGNPQSLSLASLMSFNGRYYVVTLTNLPVTQG